MRRAFAEIVAIDENGKSKTWPQIEAIRDAALASSSACPHAAAKGGGE